MQKPNKQFSALLLLILMSMLMITPVQAVDDSAFAEVRALANSGAALLAQHTLDSQQPAADVNREDWMAWERERIRIYQQSKDWQALVKRLETLPPEVSADFKRWAVTQRAEGFIKLGQGKSARLLLQELIWTVPIAQPEADEWLSRWRRMVMNSYLVDNAVEDAHLAAIRFYQDYGDENAQDRLTRAQILLSANRPDEAMDLLAGHIKDPHAAALYLLAQLRSDSRESRKVLQAALRQMRGDWVDPALRTQLWAVVAEAAMRSGDRASATNALEHVIAAHKATPLPEGLFEFTPDTLWNAYIDFATYVGNKAQFLIGQDKQWFAAAAEAANKQPVRSRSMYALLMLQGETDASRSLATQKFVDSLSKRKQGGNLLRALFLDARQYADYATIPLTARHVMVDVALADSDITLASALMATIQIPPDGTDKYFWQLRRARIFVMGGNPEAGAEALRAILVANPQLTPEQLDRLLQVVFDLQTVNAHEAAYDLFVKVMARTNDLKLQRELYYWMAESRKASEAYAEAARLYLKSAMLPDAKAMDPWAQTARYQAADALAHAGMVRDARSLFEQLLATTQDPGRRAVLTRQLQKLWLIQK
ncbi:MAG: tetratricopeptide repeat protein [Gammaproteobacteria bacterium]